MMFVKVMNESGSISQLDRYSTEEEKGEQEEGGIVM